MSPDEFGFAQIDDPLPSRSDWIAYQKELEQREGHDDDYDFNVRYEIVQLWVDGTLQTRDEWLASDEHADAISDALHAAEAGDDE